MMNRTRPRPSIRRRLTALHSGIFFFAGVLVVLTSYVLVQHNLRAGLADDKQTEIVQRLVGDGTAKNLPADKPLLVLSDGTAVTVNALRSWLVADRQELVDDTLWVLLLQSLMVVGGLGVLSVLSGWWVSGRMLAPVHRITSTARGVAERNLHERIRLTGPDDELKELADTFDGMLERLDQAFDAQQRFAANASHELRTPLAACRTLVEVALADPEADRRIHRLGAGLLDVLDQQQRLTDSLLELARCEGGPQEREPVDLAELAGRAVSAQAADARRTGIRLHRAEGPAPTVGDPVLLAQLTHNLVQNAVRHNTPGGWVSVRTGSGEHAWLEVSNTGAELSHDEAAQVFEPFRRLGSARTGTGVGLGLSIVRSITTAHGGRVRATARPGGGLIVRVDLRPGGHPSRPAP
jgi:signal transduction histidine kinase